MTRRDDIDRLARMLDGQQSAVAEADREEQLLASLAEVLSESHVAAPPIRPEFRTALRAQVVDAAREQATSPPLLTRLRSKIEQLKYSGRVATGTGIAAMALSTGGVAGAAEHAQPGELLYGTKLAIEDVRLATTFDDISRGERALGYAGDRLDEAELAASEGDDLGAATALDGAEDRIDDGSTTILTSGQMAPVARLGETLAATTARVEALLPQLGDQAATAAAGLLLTLQDATSTVGGTLLVPEADPGVPLDETPPAPPIQVPGVDDTVPGAGSSSDTEDGGTIPVPPAADPGEGTDGGAVPDLEAPPLELPDAELPDIDVPVEVPGLEDALDGALEGIGDTSESALDTLVPTEPELPGVGNGLDGVIPADLEGIAPLGSDLDDDS